ncbi:MAG TPA: hypothetical protein VI603_00260 [Saprospiraceae bacterium]|nr:hypothetical protein [Saprospiraceae bacterium]
MKIKYLLLSLSMALVAATGYAGNSVNTEDNPDGIVQMEDLMADKALVKVDKQLLKAEKQQYRTEKRIAWFSKVINKKMAKSKQKALGGLDDPVDKYFWYWLIGWGAGLVLTIIASAIAVGGAFSSGFGVAWVLFFLGWLAWIGGTIMGIIWLIKKFG